MTNPNDPAFSRIGKEIGKSMWLQGFESAGLTKREYFSAMAMQASITADPESQHPLPIHASWAVEAADALILELNKKPNV